MSVLYIYALDTMADWEIANLSAEVHSKRFFKKEAPSYDIQFTGASLETITTMGGIPIHPACMISDIIPQPGDILLLPGADTWNDAMHIPAVAKAQEFLSAGNTVSAICGATVALACAGLLDARLHTSNGTGFLEMFAPQYKGSQFYLDAPACRDCSAGTLISAAGTAALLFAKYILEEMNVMAEPTLSAWYDYFSTGSAEQFFNLMRFSSESRA